MDKTEIPLFKVRDFGLIGFVLLIIPMVTALQWIYAYLGFDQAETTSTLNEAIKVEAGIALMCAAVYLGIVALRIRDKRTRDA